MIKIIDETESLCPYCLKKIPAQKIIENNDVYLLKKCPEHGEFKVLIWRDANLYESWSKYSSHAEIMKQNSEFKKGCPYDCGLCSQHEGGTCTAVMEITYNCNMNCPICFAQANKNSANLPIKIIEKMYQTIIDKTGVPSIQLSGGEPTTRDDLPEIIAMGKKMGFPHIQVNTNGIRIAQDIEYLYKLKESGVDLIYLQFDGVSDDIYMYTRGRKILDIKIKAIENCKKVGIGVLLVPCIVPKINDHQIGDIIDFAKKWMPYIKGIHFQPVSYFGRYPLESIKDENRYTLSDLVKNIEEQTNSEIKLKNIIPRKREDSHCAFSSSFVLMEDGVLKATTEYGKETKEVFIKKMKEYNALKCDKSNNKEYFAQQANKFTNTHWRYVQENDDFEKSKWDEFKQRIKSHSLSITGMPFQDVWNVDIKRLKGCCVNIISDDFKLIPLCAFHITSVSGERLYKNHLI